MFGLSLSSSVSLCCPVPWPLAGVGTAYSVHSIRHFLVDHCFWLPLFSTSQISPSTWLLAKVTPPWCHSHRWGPSCLFIVNTKPQQSQVAVFAAPPAPTMALARLEPQSAGVRHRALGLDYQTLSSYQVKDNREIFGNLKISAISTACGLLIEDLLPTVKTIIKI